MLKLIFLPALLLSGLHAAGFEACPAAIEVEPQQLSKPVPGWTASDSTAAEPAARSHMLWFVKVYEGEPKDKADLVPDIHGPLTHGWTLTPSRGAYWLECHYTQTSVVLARPLPGGLKSCVVTVEKDISVDGHPAVRRLDCR